MAYPLEQKHVDALIGMGLNPDNYELSDDFLTFRRKTEQPVSPAMDADTPQPKLSVGTPVEDRNFEAFAKSAIHSAPAAALGGATMAVAAPFVATGPPGWATLALLGLGSSLAGQYGSEKLREVTMSDEQLADYSNLMAANPTAAMLGSLASMPVGGFNPSPSNVVKALGSTGKLATGMRLMDEEIPNLANVAMGTGMGTGLGIAQPLIMEGRMPSLGEAFTAGLTGALFNKPNVIGRSLGFQDPSVASRLPNEQTQITGRPFTTSIRTSPEAMAWDALNVAQAELPAHTGEIPVGKRALQQMEQIKPAKVPEVPAPEVKTAPPQPKLEVAPEPIPAAPEPAPAKPTVAPVEQLALEGAKEAKALETPTKQTKVAKLKLEEIQAKWDNASAEERATMAGEDYSYLAPVDWADLNGPERKGIAAAIRAKQPKQSESSPFREEKMRPLSEYERQAVEDVKKSGVPLTPTFEWFHLMRAFNAKIRGAKTKLSKQLEARGQFNPATDEITLSAQRGKLFALDTPAHEGIHAFQKFLRESPVEADRAFATTMEDVVGQSPEFQRINAERAKVGMEPWTPEEFITTESGANFIRRRLLRKDEESFTNWFKDMRAYLRTRFIKNGTLEDYRRMLTYRYMTDKPTGNATVRETPVKMPTTAPAAQPIVQKSDQSAFEPEGTSDYARYQQLAARLVKPDGSIDMEAWRELEAVKNRNQGMPPAKPVEDTTPAPTITPKAAAVKPVRNTLEEPPADVSLNSEQSPFASEQTETPEFKRWFGDSKVVDSEGKPLRVYHGTTSPDFAEFNTEGYKARGYTYGEGAYFTPEKERASAYANMPERDVNRALDLGTESAFTESKLMDPARVYPTFVSLKKPFVTRSDAGVSDIGARLLKDSPVEYRTLAEELKVKNGYSSAQSVSPVEVGNLWLRKQGYDGVIKDWGTPSKPNIVEVVAFEPTQIKSAIGNSGTFDPTNPDITKSESSPFAEEFYGKNLVGRGLTHTVAANIDRIATMGEPGKKAAGALTKFYEKNRQYRGELEQTFIRKLIGLRPSSTIGEYWRQDNPDFRRVVEFRDRVQDGESLTPESFLTPKQREINDLVTENNAQSWSLMKSFPKLAALHKGEAGDSANYLAHVLSREAAQEIAEHPNSEKSKAYKQEFIDYQLANSKTPNEAEAIKQWQILRGGLSKETHNIAEKFGPIDKSAGVGLPRSMREKSLLDRMSRFNRRYARRIAYHEAVELNGDAEQALFNPESGLESNAEVKDVLEDIFGVRERDEAVRQAALGVVRAGMLGPLTGAKDFVSNFSLGLQHQDLGQLIPSVQFALKNAKDNYARAVGTGVARYNISGLEMGEGGITQSINFLHRLRDVMNTVQGRQALEMATRTVAFGQGKYLAIDAFHSLANARMTPQKLKFLKDFAPDYKSYKGKMPDEKTLDLIAARYVESVQGSYDYRGLPSIAMKGSLTPYLALARWNIEKFNNFTKHVVEPARQGNWTPLLNATIGMLAGGAAVTALVEAATGRKDRMPKVAEIKEALPEEQAQMIAYKLAGLASMSGYAGALGDVIKSVMDKMHGNRPQTWSNPLIEAGVTGWNTAYDMVEAIQNGDVPAFTDAMNAILEDYFQSYRIAVAQLSPEKQKELQARNESRDLRVYKSGRGLPTSKYTRERANPFMNPEVRRFKETEDVAEAMRLGRKLTSEAVAEAEGDPARLRSGLTRLKINSLATMPSPERDPRLFRDYTDYLGRTQGEDVAAERRARFLKKRAFNSAKASMIP